MRFVSLNLLYTNNIDADIHKGRVGRVKGIQLVCMDGATGVRKHASEICKRPPTDQNHAEKLQIKTMGAQAQ